MLARLSEHLLRLLDALLTYQHHAGHLWPESAVRQATIFYFTCFKEIGKGVLMTPFVLIAEDNDEDFFTLQRALAQTEVKLHIERCQKGDDVLDYLYRRGRFANQQHPRPFLLLLDLNLPGMDGRHVLRTLKSDLTFKTLPVVVITTSNNPRDVIACYEAGANSYLVKSFHFQQFRSQVRSLVDYWFQTCTLPGQTELV